MHDVPEVASLPSGKSGSYVFHDDLECMCRYVWSHYVATANKCWDTRMLSDSTYLE